MKLNILKIAMIFTSECMLSWTQQWTPNENGRHTRHYVDVTWDTKYVFFWTNIWHHIIGIASTKYASIALIRHTYTIILGWIVCNKVTYCRISTYLINIMVVLRTYLRFSVGEADSVLDVTVDRSCSVVCSTPNMCS